MTTKRMAKVGLACALEAVLLAGCGGSANAVSLAAPKPQPRSDVSFRPIRVKSPKMIAAEVRETTMGPFWAIGYIAQGSGGEIVGACASR